MYFTHVKSLDRKLITSSMLLFIHESQMTLNIIRTSWNVFIFYNKLVERIN